jgi:hypothetical protein
MTSLMDASEAEPRLQAGVQMSVKLQSRKRLVLLTTISRVKKNHIIVMLYDQVKVITNVLLQFHGMRQRRKDCYLCARDSSGTKMN